MAAVGEQRLLRSLVCWVAIGAVLVMPMILNAPDAALFSGLMCVVAAAWSSRRMTRQERRAQASRIRYCAGFVLPWVTVAAAWAAGSMIVGLRVESARRAVDSTVQELRPRWTADKRIAEAEIRGLLETRRDWFAASAHYWRQQPDDRGTFEIYDCRFSDFPFATNHESDVWLDEWGTDTG